MNANYDPFLIYPPQPDTHPECPMWVRGEGHGAGWYRVIDMVHVKRHGGGWYVTFPGVEEPTRVHPSEVSPPGERRYDDGAVFEYLDSEHPPRCPDVRVGQVWLIFEGEGVAELVISSIMRFFDGRPPAVILPIIEEGGSISHQVIPWDKPTNAIMVHDLEGPKVWTPPGWTRPTGAGE